MSARPRGPHGTLVLDDFDRPDDPGPLSGIWDPVDFVWHGGLKIVGHQAIGANIGGANGFQQLRRTFPAPAEAFVTLVGLVDNGHWNTIQIYEPGAAHGAACDIEHYGSDPTHKFDLYGFGDEDAVQTYGSHLVDVTMAPGDGIAISYDGRTFAAWHRPVGGVWVMVDSFVAARSYDLLVIGPGGDIAMDDFGGGSYGSVGGPHGTPILDDFNRADQPSPLGSPWLPPPGLYSVAAAGLGISGGRAVADTPLGGEDYGLESMPNPTPDLRGEVFATLPSGDPGDWIYLDLFSGDAPGRGVYELEVRNTGDFNLYDIMDDGSTPQYGLDMVNHAIAVGSSVAISFADGTMTAWYRPLGGSWEVVTKLDSVQEPFTIAGLGIATGAFCPVENFGGGGFRTPRERGEWQPGETYSAGDRATWRGANLIAAKDHTAAPAASNPWAAAIGGAEEGLFPSPGLFPGPGVFPSSPGSPRERGGVVDPGLWKAATPHDAAALRSWRLTVDPVPEAIDPTESRPGRRRR